MLILTFKYAFSRLISIDVFEGRFFNLKKSIDIN